ncbi:MAG TPA: hypothetical protein VL970_04435, partial [Candidatus Acidoferrales bacterium]|nr:hypothetical protein [Candidatus Acidoferrales bacterium]
QAQQLLLASSDLSRVKVTRRDPKTGKSQEWTFDCSNAGATPIGNRNWRPAVPSLNLQSNNDANNTTEHPDFWLENGDVIEVPER